MQKGEIIIDIIVTLIPLTIAFFMVFQHKKIAQYNAKWQKKIWNIEFNEKTLKFTENFLIAMGGIIILIGLFVLISELLKRFYTK